MTQVTIKPDTPLDEKIHDYVDQIEFDDPDWVSTSIRIPQPFETIIGNFVDDQRVGQYKVLTAAIIHGHKRFEQEFENELLELRDLFMKATNTNKFASSHLSARGQSNHYEFPLTGESMSNPRRYWIHIKKKGRIEQQARWVGFGNAMFQRHLMALALLDTQYGVNSIWSDELIRYRDGFREYLQEWRVPTIIALVE